MITKLLQGSIPQLETPPHFGIWSSYALETVSLAGVGLEFERPLHRQSHLFRHPQAQLPRFRGLVHRVNFSLRWCHRYTQLLSTCPLHREVIQKQQVSSLALCVSPFVARVIGVNIEVKTASVSWDHAIYPKGDSVNLVAQ